MVCFTTEYIRLAGEIVTFAVQSVRSKCDIPFRPRLNYVTATLDRNVQCQSTLKTGLGCAV